MEPDRDYLTRWSSLRNTCEGVHEIQAVGFFINGCRDSTMLKHRLLLDDPQTMAELMAIADKYATVDSAMRVLMQIDRISWAQEKPVARDQAGPSNTDNRAGRDNRDRREQDNRKRSDALDK